MKKKLWVKVAAFALALTLLWMNMADVRNILDANAETEGSEEVNADEPKIGEISLDKTQATDGDTVTVTVPIEGTVNGVKVIFGAENSEATYTKTADPDETDGVWKAALSVSEDDLKDGKVFVSSVTATYGSEGAEQEIKGTVAEDADSADANTAKYSFTVKRQSAGGDNGGDDPSKNPEETDTDQNGGSEEGTLAIEDISVKIEGKDGTTASVGDTVTISANIKGEASKVEVVLGLEGSEDTHAESMEDAGEGVWNVNLVVNEDGWLTPGKWYIASVTATPADGSDEVKGVVSTEGADSADADSAEYFFAVIEAEQPPEENEPDDNTPKDPEQNGNADITKPVIEEIVIDPQVGETVKDGDTVKIQIKAYDTGDGIKSIGLELKNEYYSGSYGVAVAYDKTTQTGEAVLNVSEKDWLKGKVYIYHISVTDQMGNVKYGDVDTRSADINWAQADTAKYWFVADRSDMDTQKPEIQEVKLTPNGGTVKPGEKVELQVMATDDVAVKANGCVVWLKCEEHNSNNYNTKCVFLNWDQEKECYCGELEITKSLYPGRWKVWYAQVEDTAGNDAEFYPEDITFTIQQDEAYDKELPQVKSVQMEKTGEILEAGASVRLSVEATDNKGIDSVRVGMCASMYADINYDKGHKNIQLERVDGTDRYEGCFEIDTQTYPCEWYVDYLYIEDTTGNYRYIYSCNSGEYVERRYYGICSQDSYSLEEKFYVMVEKDGTLLNPNVTVCISGELVKVGDGSWWYDSYGVRSVEVSRRATIREIQQLCGTAETPEGLTFEGWTPKRGTSDTGEDSMVLWEGNSVYAKYDKNLVMLTLTDQDDEDNAVYRNVIFGNESDTLPLPKTIPGLHNIKWEKYVDGEMIEIDNVVVGSDPVQYVYGCAEVDADAPVTPDTPVTPDVPVTPDTPVNPAPTGPVSLSDQKIAEVSAEVAAAGNGAVVTVNMGAATVVPKDILEAAKGKDVKVVLEMDGYSWTIDGKDILSSNLKDVNLRVIRNTEYIPVGLISRLAGDNPVEQITLEYNGDFGFAADLTMNIGSQYAGKNGSLYWHDSDGRMIFMNAGAIDTAGNVTLGFSHASDYAIVITGPAATVAPNTTAVPVAKPAAVAVKTGDTTPIAFYAILLIAALAAGGMSVCGAAVYRKKHSGRRHNR